MHPRLLEFGNEDMVAHDVEREVPPVDEDVEMDDVGDYKLPEQDAAVCSRNCYQRFLTRYRRWVESQVAEEEEEVRQDQLKTRLTLAYKTTEQQKEVGASFLVRRSSSDFRGGQGRH